MPRNLLTARQVQTANDGDHSDGDGLMLRVTDGRATWVFRFTSPSGKRREQGLGVCHRGNIADAGKSLTIARNLAEKSRGLLRDKIDPIDHDRAERAKAKREEQAKKAAAQAERHTLARVARQYHERVIEPSRTAKHGAQWIASLENHVPGKLWHSPIDSITAPALLDFYTELYGKVPETASRVVQRMRAIFGDAEFRGWCAGNPADAAARKLRELRLRRDRRKFTALPFDQVPAFMRELRQREGIAARALEFAILTTARTGEVIGAQWGEFDLDAGLWAVPASRMKGGEAHTVYLSSRAVEIVRAAQEWGGDFVFPTPGDPTKRLSNMAMLTLLRRMGAGKRTTVHGLCRASFSTWANETGAARSEVIEACLAHREGDRVRAAYNRATFAAERRRLLATWADYCADRVQTRKVVSMVRAA